MKWKQLTVVGLAFVGMPTVVIFLHEGYNVVGVDVDRVKVESVD